MMIQDRNGVPWPPYVTDIEKGLNTTRYCLYTDCITNTMTTWRDSLSAAGMQMDFTVRLCWCQVFPLAIEDSV